MINKKKKKCYYHTLKSLTAILWIVKKQFPKQLEVRYHCYPNNGGDRVVSVTVENYMPANTISQYKHGQDVQEVSRIYYLKLVGKYLSISFMENKHF